MQKKRRRRYHLSPEICARRREAWTPERRRAHGKKLRAAWTPQRRADRAEEVRQYYKLHPMKAVTRKRISKALAGKACPQRGRPGQKHPWAATQMRKNWSDPAFRHRHHNRMNGRQLSLPHRQRLKDSWTEQRREQQRARAMERIRRGVMGRAGKKWSEEARRKFREHWTKERRHEQMIRLRQHYQNLKAMFSPAYYLSVANSVSNASADELQGFSEVELKICALVNDPEGWFISKSPNSVKGVMRAKMRARKWMKLHPNYSEGDIGLVLR